jgi:hypothetical protein
VLVALKQRIKLQPISKGKDNKGSIQKRNIMQGETNYHAHGENAKEKIGLVLGVRTVKLDHQR